jgi:hypothetical protein
MGQLGIGDEGFGGLGELGELGAARPAPARQTGASSPTESKSCWIGGSGWLKSIWGGKMVVSWSLNQTSNGRVEAAKRRLPSTGSIPSR